MNRNLAAFISLAVFLSGSITLNTESVEAKTSQKNPSSARNNLVPPPPPYTPTVSPSALGMANGQEITSVAVDSSVPFALSTKFVEAKTSRISSARAGNYFVPPPPPCMPSIVPSVLGMINNRSTTADANYIVVEKPGSPSSQYIFTRNQGDSAQVVQANQYSTYNPAVERKILKHVENFDSEISSIEKEIGKLLNL